MASGTNSWNDFAECAEYEDCGHMRNLMRSGLFPFTIKSQAGTNVSSRLPSGNVRRSIGWPVRLARAVGFVVSQNPGRVC